MTTEKDIPIPEALKDWRFLCGLCELLHHIDYWDCRPCFDTRLIKTGKRGNLTSEELEKYEYQIRDYYCRLRERDVLRGDFGEEIKQQVLNMKKENASH